jgi:hypothetical protein
VARMGEGRGVYRAMVWRPEGKRPLGRPRRRWGIILRWTFRKWDGVLGVDGGGSGSGQVAGTCEYGNELSGSVKCGEFLD